MELTMSNGLCEMSVNEILLLDGGEWSWSWSDFGASTAGNCVGGAAAGGVTAVFGLLQELELLEELYGEQEAIQQDSFGKDYLDNIKLYLISY